MKLSSLIPHLEKKFETRVLPAPESDGEIDTVLFYTPNLSTIEERALYLVNGKEYPPASIPLSFFHNYLLFCGTNLPKDQILPRAMFLNKSPSLYDVNNAIQEKLFEIHQMNLKKEELFHVLQKGLGLQGILDAASPYLKQTITLCSTDYSVLCRSPRNEESRQFDFHNGKHYLKNDAILNMQKSDITQMLLSSNEPFLYHFDDEPQKEYLFCSVRIHQTMIAYLCVEADLGQFTENSRHFVFDLAKILSVEMQKDNFFKERSGLSEDYLLSELIEHTITNEDFARHRMEGLSIRPGKEFQFLVFSFLNQNQKQISHMYYIEQLRDLFPSSLSGIYQHHMVLLLTGDRSHFSRLLRQKRLESFLIHNQMAVGCSFVFFNLIQAHLFYRQSCFVLDSATTSDSGKCLAYDNYVLRHFFSLIPDSQVLNTFIHPDILILREHDHLYQTSYCQTLQCFLSQNCNGQKTAGQLNIHKSTLFYRLEKMKELTGMNLEDHNCVLQYELSFQVLGFPVNGALG